MVRRDERGRIPSLVGSGAAWLGSSFAVSADDEVIAWPAARAKSSATTPLASSFGKLCHTSFSTPGPLPTLSSMLGSSRFGVDPSLTLCG